MIKLINILKETKVSARIAKLPSHYVYIIDKITDDILAGASGFDLESPLKTITNPDLRNINAEEDKEQFNNFINSYSEGTTFLTNDVELANYLEPAPGAPKFHYRCKIIILKNYNTDGRELTDIFKNSIKIEIPHENSDIEYYTGWFTSDGKYHGDIQNFDEEGNRIQ